MLSLFAFDPGAPVAQPLNLIVAGGGIGGLDAAFVLGRDGHAAPCSSSRPPSAIGAGIQLGPNIFRMFDHPAGFAGLQWMYQGIAPDRLFD